VYTVRISVKTLCNHFNIYKGFIRGELVSKEPKREEKKEKEEKPKKPPKCK